MEKSRQPIWLILMLALLPWQSLKAQDELFGISREQDSLATDTPEADSLAKAQLDSLPWNRRVEQKRILQTSC